MKKLSTLILLAVAAVTASAQEIRFEGVKGNFNTAMAIPEMIGLTHGVDENGSPTITIESRNGAIYTSPAEGVNINTTLRTEPNARGKFQNITKVIEYTDIDELECGDFMGYADELDFDLENYVKESYALASTFGVRMDSIILPYVKANAQILALKNGLAVNDIRFHACDIIYVGLDNMGNKVPLSARMLYPYNKNRNNLMLTDIYLDNHVTIFRTGLEPTGAFSYFSPGPVCSKGYLVVQPDLLGFGSTLASSQLYVDNAVNGAGSAYAIVAAQQFAKWMQNRPCGFRINPNAPLINAGASQGASTALSTTYFIEKVLDKTKYNIPLKETRLAAGAYDMKLCMDKFCEADSIVYGCKIPMLIQGVAVGHHDLLKKEDGTEYTIHDYFAPHAKTFQYTHTDGVNYGTIWQILDKKTTLAPVIEGCLAYAFNCGPKAPKRASFRKMLAPDMFIGEGEDVKLNWDCDKLKCLQKYFDLNDYTSTDLWIPTSKITLVAAPTDDIVPYENATKFYETMSPYNSQIRLSTLNQLPPPFGALAAYGDHMMVCFVWILAEITGLPVEVVNQILISQMS